MPSQKSKLFALIAIGALLSWGAVIFVIARLSSPIALPALTAARSVHIEEDWSGYNDIAPVLAHYDLISFNDSFQGSGFFSIAGYSGPAGHPSITDTVMITVPVGAMHNLFSTLEQAKAYEGSYPTPSCCDDYP